MARIILEIDRYESSHLEYVTLETDYISIGRGLDNTVIINDPYVSAHHVEIRVSDDSWECQDQGSENGTFVSNKEDSSPKSRITKALPLHSGDVLIIGKTSIRVCNSNQAIAPTKILDKNRFHIPQKINGKCVLTLLAFYLIYYVILSKTIPKKTIPPFEILTSETFILLAFVLWSSIWAAITRFSKRQHQFIHHLIFTCQWSIVSWFSFFFLGYISFFFCNAQFELLSGLGLLSILGIISMNTHLAIATNMNSLNRIRMSCAIIITLTGLCAMAYYSTINNFNPNPQHFINFVAWPKKTIPTIPLSQEIQHLDHIFQK